MHIIYAVTGCSENVYQSLFSDVAMKPAVQSQKYHRLLIEGLAENAEIDVVANPPVNKALMTKAVVPIPKETVKGANYHYIYAIRNPFVKLVCVAFGTFFKTLFLCKKDTVVFVDCLNRVTSLAALMAARLRRKRCVGIVTDLPEMLIGSNLNTRLSNFVIQHCTDYVLLTEAMNDYLNHNGKPYVVLEGHADITMKKRETSIEGKRHPRICMYAGAIAYQYGLMELIEGFQKAQIPDAELHLYGPCDDEQEIRKIAEENPTIYYGGILLNSEIVEKELEATLLVNPRPTHEEFVKYSFPSKNMEYMASGTPLLTTVMPGMPKEYYPHVYLLEDETADGIVSALTEILSRSDEALYEKGREAKEFILNTRNNVVQAKKILDMLETKQ